MERDDVQAVIHHHLHSPRGTFEAQLIHTFRQVGISVHRIGKSTWRWRPEEVSPAYTALLLRTSGTITVTSAGEVLAPGSGRPQRDAVLLHSAHEATLWFGGAEAACLIVWVPDHLITGLGLRGEVPAVLPPTVLVSAARSMITTIVEQTTAQEAEGNEIPVIERLLVGVVVGLLFDVYPHLGGVDGTVSDIERAHSLILTNLRDPSYTSERLAGDLKMSRRQVQRLFARFDTTPTETMRRFRAEIALAQLHDRHRSGVTAAEIASRVGFGSETAMRRAIRTLIGPADAHSVREPPGDTCRAIGDRY